MDRDIIVHVILCTGIYITGRNAFIIGFLVEARRLLYSRSMSVIRMKTRRKQFDGVEQKIAVFVLVGHTAAESRHIFKPSLCHIWKIINDRICEIEPLSLLEREA